MTWFIDGNNVMGSVPDGWWNDPSAAAARLTARVARWCQRHDDTVVLVFDGPTNPAALVLAGGNLDVRFASRSGRDAADDDIVTAVELAFAGTPDVRVVTADRGLVARLPPGVHVVRPHRFLGDLDGEAPSES